MERRFAAAYALDVLDDLRHGGPRLGERGGMRGDADARMLPERIARRQGLGVEDIQVGVREVSRIQRGDEVGHHDVRRAGEVDEAAVLAAQAEVAVVGDAPSWRSER